MSDEGLVADLQATAVRHGDRLAVGPVPWDAIRRRHRRTGVRRAGLVTGTAAALVAALALGPGDLLPGRSDPLPAHGFDGPVGRLAADRAWVDGLLQRAGQGRTGAPGRVLFADDIAEARLALVALGPDRISPTPMVAWYVGPPGAAPAAMVPSSSDDVRDGPAATVVTGTAKAGYATVVVVGRPGGRLSAWTHNDVDRDGRVASAVVTGQEVRPGLYTARIAVPYPQVDVRLTGLGRDDWRGPARDLTPQPGAGTDTRPPRLDDAAWWAAAQIGARGDAAAPPPGLAVQQTYNALGLSGAVPGSRVLWASSGTSPARSVLALKAPSGGWVLVACTSTPPVTDADGGTSVGSSLEAVATRPDGPPGGLALVWPFLSQPDPDRTPAPSGRYGLLGPATAVLAQVPTAEGTVEVPLQDGTAVTGSEPTGPVTFLGPAGVLATVPVSPAWDWQGDGVLAHQS